jgi:hypothetical protein
MDVYSANWNESDASNSTAAPDGWPEGMAPSGVNDSGRAMMGAVKRYVDQHIPLVTGGTSTAYTLAYAVTPSGVADGMTHLVQFNQACGTSPTLNVNALGAKPLHKYHNGAWTTLVANDVSTDMVCKVAYNAGAGTYRIVGSANAPTMAGNTWTPTDTTGTLTLSNVSATYQRIGNLVFAQFSFTCSGGSGAANLFGGLPVAAANANYANGGGGSVAGSSANVLAQVVSNSTTFKLLINGSNQFVTNALNGQTLTGTIIYPAV